ncbi:hypothetical protein DN069_27170 [Streptacidiphilus pinicola]|uniref:Uncharacterized protein n=1 Tax=Streptacidiphilus pinicola TaxID=2219663 RepID=A0A2X0IGI9_9ACTN|nr:hypothetical protein [Streptacidiphilus pinicola]RAG82531.1 hypothetical protein DN069_27170 [Streptacidiphilus pinicola]
MSENEDQLLGREEPEEGGEPACWLHRLCPECDAVQDEARPTRCWRCGATLGGTASGGTASGGTASGGDAGAADLR